MHATGGGQTIWLFTSTAEGFENTGLPWNKSMKCSEWDSNPGTANHSATLPVLDGNEYLLGHRFSFAELFTSSENSRVSQVTRLFPQNISRKKERLEAFSRLFSRMLKIGVWTAQNLNVHISGSFLWCGGILKIRIYPYIILYQFTNENYRSCNWQLRFC